MEFFMQELILVISKCISNKKSYEKDMGYYQFHFKGFYRGEKIKIIHLFPSKLQKEHNKTEQLSKGDDYLLWVQQRRVYGEILEVDLIKFKKIN
jgi:hypothetical protein